MTPSVPQMMTASGEGVWFDNPELTPIRDFDLRTGMENICRYKGQYKYSLLSHSVLVGCYLEVVSPRLGALGAVHDMHECYTDDRNPRDKTPEFRMREGAWSYRVHEHFGLAYPEPSEAVTIHVADRMALMAEMIVNGHPAAEWSEEMWEQHGGYKPLVSEENVTLARELRDADPDNLWEELLQLIALGGGNCVLGGVHYGSPDAAVDVPGWSGGRGKVTNATRYGWSCF